MADYSCYVKIINKTTTTMFLDGTPDDKWGSYESQPAQKIQAGDSTEFQLRDHAGAWAGSEGYVKYFLSNDDDLKFEYECPLSGDNKVKAHSETGVAQITYYGKNSDTYLTNIPSGKANSYPKDGHPLSVIFIVE